MGFYQIYHDPPEIFCIERLIGNPRFFLNFWCTPWNSNYFYWNFPLLSSTGGAAIFFLKSQKLDFLHSLLLDTEKKNYIFIFLLAISTSLPLYLKSIGARTDHKGVKKNRNVVLSCNADKELPYTKS